MHSFVDRFSMRIVDTYFALRPRFFIEGVAPKLVSHRGVHDNVSILENTVAAFDAAQRCGAWGIELDVQWTRDGYPVVIHDTNCLRVFGHDIIVPGATLMELKVLVPSIPTLQEVVSRYGGKMHLMIELKTETYCDHFSQTLYSILKYLEPCTDYHILSLSLDVLDGLIYLPKQSFLPIAKRNVEEMSRASINRGYGGMTGHYLLINDSIMQAHKGNGQLIGTGFVSSRNCLYREVGRDVDWIFTNHLHKFAENQCRRLG